MNTRIEVIAAYVLGVMLPVLEVLRRRTDFSDLPAYADDFLIGTFLLYAAYSVVKRQRGGNVLLCTAWGILCGGMYSSFFSQLKVATDVSGAANNLVIAVKGIIFLIAIVCLVLSVRFAVAVKQS